MKMKIWTMISKIRFGIGIINVLNAEMKKKSNVMENMHQFISVQIVDAK